MTTTAAYHRHDSSDRAWAILERLLPGGPGKVGRPAQNNRRFINTAFRVLGAGASWRYLPPDYDTGVLPTIASATGRKMALGSDSWTPWPTTPTWSG